MHRLNVIAVAAIVTLGFIAGCAVPTSERSVTAYEGARLIVGDGRVIDNATLVVDGAKIAQAGGCAMCLNRDPTVMLWGRSVCKTNHARSYPLCLKDGNAPAFELDEQQLKDTP